MVKTFPRRTVLLMVFALLAFFRLWKVSHQTAASPELPEVRLVSHVWADAGGAP